MLFWAACLFCVSLFAEYLGYPNVASAVLAMAQILFALFVVFFLVSGLARVMKTRKGRSL